MLGWGWGLHFMCRGWGGLVRALNKASCPHKLSPLEPSAPLTGSCLRSPQLASLLMGTCAPVVILPQLSAGRWDTAGRAQGLEVHRVSPCVSLRLKSLTRAMQAAPSLWHRAAVQGQCWHSPLGLVFTLRQHPLASCCHSSFPPSQRSLLPRSPPTFNLHII